MREMKKEKDVKLRVKTLLDKHGWFWFMPPANAYGRTGISDFIAIRAGVMLAVETKFQSKPTPMQVGFLRSIAAESGMAFLVDEKTIETFASWLAAFDTATKMAGEGKTPGAEVGGPLLDAIKAMTEGYA
jgi:hypothetical protein